MNILILGPAQRNSAIAQYLTSTGHQCRSTEAAVSPEELTGVDWLVVNGYAPILKQAAITLMKNRVINVHPSHLPYGRGIFPLFWALFYGWPTGVSLHLIDEGIDTGPVLACKPVQPASPDETLRSFNRRLLDEASRLLIDSWPGITSGEIQPRMQPTVAAALVFKTRLQSEAFVDLLPDLWETPLSVVAQLGEAFRGNLCFLEHTTLPISSLR
jgi:methionyl-tRNA formyltransferase